MWVIKDILNKRKNCKTNDSECQKGPIICYFVEFWIYFELIILAAVLITRKTDDKHTKDIIFDGFCEADECTQILFKIIVWKILFTLLLNIGCRTASLQIGLRIFSYAN